MRDRDEIQELADALAERLAQRGVADGSRLLDLMRAERNLQDALRVVRQEIEVILRSTPPPEQMPPV